MNNNITDLDYIKIIQEFERVKDYRTFILQYSHVQHPEIQFLIIQANWLIILNERDLQQQKRDLMRFIRKYRHYEDIRVKNFVIHAMLIQLEQNQYDQGIDDYIDACNVFIEYTNSIEQRPLYAKKGLVLAYWFKAQTIHNKDWRKSKYFYNKVIEFGQNLADKSYVLYLIKAEIAKVKLYLNHGHSEPIEKRFYSVIRKYAHYQHQEIISVLDKLINLYVHHLIAKEQWFYQAEQGRLFTEFLNRHSDMQKIILKSQIQEIAVPRLVWIAYLCWINQYQALSEKYLLRHFQFFVDWDEVLLSFKEYLQFNTAKDRELFLEYAAELYQRHLNLEKYRKIFKLDKSKY